MKGLATPKIEGKFSLRASSTGEIVMDEVFVPDDESCCPMPAGLSRSLRLFESRARYGIAWGALGRGGISAGMLLANTPWIGQQFGRPLAANQLIQFKLAEYDDKHRIWVCKARCASDACLTRAKRGPR